MKAELKTLINEPESCLVADQRKLKRRIIDLDNQAGDFTRDQISGPGLCMGRQLIRLPVDPRPGRVIIAARR